MFPDNFVGQHKQINFFFKKCTICEKTAERKTGHQRWGQTQSVTAELEDYFLNPCP